MVSRACLRLSYLRRNGTRVLEPTAFFRRRRRRHRRFTFDVDKGVALVAPFDVVVGVDHFRRHVAVVQLVREPPALIPGIVDALFAHLITATAALRSRIWVSPGPGFQLLVRVVHVEGILVVVGSDRRR